MALRDPPPPRCPDWFASPPALSSSKGVFDGFSRPTAREIRATIAFVENAPESDVGVDVDFPRSIAENDENQEGKVVDLSPAWLHSNAFEILALRNANGAGGWDRRLSSKEVMAKIKAVEEYERDKREEEQKQRGPPQARREEKEGEAADVGSQASELTKPPKVETAEEKKRRERAEARARKIEAIAGRRHVGEDDDASAVSGMSKRQRMRRKKKAVAALAAMEERSAAAIPAKVQTEAERRRKERATMRAKKIEAMFDQRNAGDVDDGASTVTGISKRHRMRRKKAATVVINPEEQARNDWKENVYASVLNAEQSKWKTSIYGHVLNAEATRSMNLEAQRKLDEQNAAAQRRAERAKKIATRAQRFEVLRHERYGPGQEDNDDGSVAGSVVSAASKHRRRRRTRKSAAAGVHRTAIPPVGEEASPVALAAEQRETHEREEWCNSVYASVLGSEQSKWKGGVFGHVLGAEESKRKRLEVEAQVARERAAAEALQEKERRKEERAEKAERMFRDRSAADGVENAALYDGEGPSAVGSPAAPSSLKKMRDRRRKAARKKSASKSPMETPKAGAPIEAAMPPVEETAAAVGVPDQAQMPLEETVATAFRAATRSAPAAETEEEKRERERWCRTVYVSVLGADASSWRRNVYGHILRAEEAKRERLEEEKCRKAHQLSASRREEAKRKRTSSLNLNCDEPPAREQSFLG